MHLLKHVYIDRQEIRDTDCLKDTFGQLIIVDCGVNITWKPNEENA